MPISLSERHVIAEMKQQRRADVRPRHRSRHRYETQQWHGNDAAGNRDQGDGEQRFKPQLEQRIPAGMTGRRAEHGNEYHKIHAPPASSTRARSSIASAEMSSAEHLLLDDRGSDPFPCRPMANLAGRSPFAHATDGS